jgi:hypothetical protein
MAEAILTTLAHPPERAALTARGAEFSVDRAVERYLALIADTGFSIRAVVGEGAASQPHSSP